MKNESALPTVLRRNLPPNLEKIKNGHFDKNHPDYSIHMYLKENDIKVEEDGSNIVEFLRGKNVLVTGATGFLGKALIEKLLRCCKDLGTVFIIIRSKKGKDPKERLDEFLNNWVFHKLSGIYPNYKEKVVGINGDFEEDRVGLSEESSTTLKAQVNIIYHVAATVRFDEKLKKSVKVNLRGTQEMIRLAKECQKLDAFVHVSSAFSNCHEMVIKEEFYPPHFDPYKLMTIMEELPDDVAENITPQILGSVPNTYAFTKQIAEDLVRREAVGIPSCIHRPSIVIASVNEPVKSWVDNIFGPVGLTEGAAIGLLHVMLGNPRGRSDMVPVDYVINSCIASSYKVAKERQLNKVQIFNYTTSKENSLCWKNLALAGEHGYNVGSTLLIMKGFHRFTACRYWYYILNFLLHTIPGYLFDFAAILVGKKPLLRAAYRKINKYVSVLSHFSLNEWTFELTNTTNLWNSLNETDKKNFPFDMKSLDWPDYFTTYMVAMREFLVVDFLDSLDAGRQLTWRLDVLFYLVVSLVVVFSVYFFINTILFFIPVTILSVIMYFLFTDRY